MSNKNESREDSLSETENYEAWVSYEEDEAVYHLDFGHMTIHFLQDEWEEFVELMSKVSET